MIGSGIYATPATVLKYVQSTGAAVLVWILGALFAFLGAMAYGEWGSRVTLSGGDAPFLDYVYTKPKHLVAILFTWVRIVLINPGYCANSAYLIGKNFLFIFPSYQPTISEQEWYPKLIAIAVLIIHSLICIPSNQIAGNFTLSITLISMACLLCIIVVGVLLVAQAIPNVTTTFSNFSSKYLFQDTNADPVHWAFALFHVMWAYDGWFNLTSSLGELKNPEKTIFQSTLLGISVTAVLFLLVNFSFLLGLPYETFIQAGDTLPIVWGRQLFQEKGQIFTACLFCLTLTACCFNTLFSSSRITQAAGEAKLIPFPQYFAHLSPRFGTPIPALVLNLVLSSFILLAAPGDTAFQFILVLVSYPVWVFITLTLSGLIYLKYQEHGLWKRPKALTHLCVWVNVGCPLVVVLLGVFLMVMPFFDEPHFAIASAIGLGCIFLGFIPYYFIEMHGTSNLLKTKTKRDHPLGDSGLDC
ncbi:hypothetical protein HMI54_008505 [Coelomomyces lativittatus]|nr:hypothetical protein HMI54_008505 [Coelomomyces lativittatus]